MLVCCFEFHIFSAEDAVVSLSSSFKREGYSLRFLEKLIAVFPEQLAEEFSAQTRITV